MPHIGSDVLAHRPVAARRGLDEPALLVPQRAGQAVDLVLGGQRDRLALGQVEETADARGKLRDVLGREGVVEAHHPLPVRDLGERRRLDRGTDKSARAVGADQMRKSVFQLFVAADERIIFGVRNLGRIVGMIASVVMGDLLCQPHQFVGSFGFGQRFNLGHTPVFATGLNSARVPNPAISGRPFAIAACTAGNCRDAACASLFSQISTIQIASAFALSSPTR